jgi:glucuronokinase
MIIRTQAHARAGLIGNPSDGYFGKTISVLVGNFAARVNLWESPRLVILAQRSDRLDYDSVDDLIGDIHLHGYYGGVRLVKAAVKRLHAYARLHALPWPAANFTIGYESDIPIRVGLAGSSAIVTAVMRALMRFYGIEVPTPQLPNLILGVELDELGIGAGLQDRVIQVYGGAVFMDFDKARMTRDGHGLYQPLDPKLLPPLYVAYHDNLAEGTEVTHNDLRSRYNRAEPAVLEAVARWADLTQQAHDLIAAGKGGQIGPLMDENYDLRAKLIKISAGNQALVATGRGLGAAVNFAGSGGAVIGMYDGDPDRLDRLRQAYQAMGAKVIVPAIAASEQ